MDSLLYWMALGLVKFFQSLPLRWVARIGRAGGGLTYYIDARHRRVAMENLRRCFGEEKTAPEIQALVRENFKRLGENYCCAIKTAGMTWSELQPHLEFGGVEKLRSSGGGTRTSEGPEMPENIVMAIGHFGNFELYARANNVLPGIRFATTYRALKEPGLNKLLLELRTRSGCLLFERRKESEALRAAMTKGRVLIGFLSDQHAGTGGVWVPFFGQICSTTSAPAVFAARYKAPLYTAICYRIGLAQWRFEVGDAIPIQQGEQRRTSEEIMLDVNRAFETAIRRDPANWFWVHKRWKPKLRESKVQSPKSKVEEQALEESKIQGAKSKVEAQGASVEERR